MYSSIYIDIYIAYELSLVKAPYLYMYVCIYVFLHLSISRIDRYIDMSSIS